MEQSILISTKKILGVGEDDTSFDLDIITHINSAFSILTNLGIGPNGGFVIEDDTIEWENYTSGFPEDPADSDHKIKLSKIKTVVWTRSKLLFDPPANSFHLDALKEQLREHEWRLNVDREAYAWVDSNPRVLMSVDDDAFGEGGFGL